MRSIMEDVKSVTPLFTSMQYLSKEVNQMNNEGHPRRKSDEDSTFYQQQRRPKNPRSPHKSTMPTFFEEGERYRSEEWNEPKTHETLSLYLEEYKAQSRAFKEKLTLQQFFQIKE